jgi:hypothetical protein
MSRQRLKTASRMVAVAAFRETVARQGLASARQEQCAAREAVEEAERGLDWLETRRVREIESGRPDPALIAWLDGARDVAGSAYTTRTQQLAHAVEQLEGATLTWTDSRQREDSFGQRADRIRVEAWLAEAKVQAEASLDVWLSRRGGDV